MKNAALLEIAGCLVATSAPAASSALRIEAGWARATPPGAQSGAATRWCAVIWSGVVVLRGATTLGPEPKRQAAFHDRRPFLAGQAPMVSGSQIAIFRVNRPRSIWASPTACRYVPLGHSAASGRYGVSA